MTDRQHRARRAQSTETGTRSPEAAPQRAAEREAGARLGGGTWALHTPRWLRKHPRAAEPPGCGPSPARGRPVTFAPGSAPESSRGASTSGAGGGGREGVARPRRRAASSPSWRGGGPGAVGGARRGRRSPPLPPSRCRPRRGSARPGGSHGPVTSCPAARVGGPRPGGRGQAGRGLRGGASGAADPSPRPAPSPRPPSRGSLASCRRPLPWRRRSRASALEARVVWFFFFFFFPPGSGSLSPPFFPPFFLSGFRSPSERTELGERQPASRGTHLREEREMGEGREVT